jgi:hypothetical protein
MIGLLPHNCSHCISRHEGDTGFCPVFAMAIEALGSDVAATSQLQSRLQLYLPK